MLGRTPQAIRHWHTRGLINPTNPGHKPLRWNWPTLLAADAETRRTTPTPALLYKAEKDLAQWQQGRVHPQATPKRPTHHPTHTR